MLRIPYTYSDNTSIVMRLREYWVLFKVRNGIHHNSHNKHNHQTELKYLNQNPQGCNLQIETAKHRLDNDVVIWDFAK
jgi:hypothetical protein